MSKIIFSKNCLHNTVIDIPNFFNINYCKIFGKYLGFSIFDKSPSNRDFYYIIENLKKKLAEWKTKFLNIAGRTILAKVSLSSIPMYVMTYI